MQPDPGPDDADDPVHQAPDGPAGSGRPDPHEDLVVEVPDDASALARDVEALRRERRAQARRDRLRRLALGRSGVGVGAPLVLAVLVAVGMVAALPVLLRPELALDPGPEPLASPTVPPGQVGGLLPDVALRAPQGTLPARSSARPGVLVLVPARCGCDDAVEQAVVQSREFTRNVRLVVDGREDGAVDEAVRLRREPARGLASSATDPAGALATAYGARGLTVVAVAADGVVLDVLRDVRAGQRLEARLSVLQPLPQE